MLGPNEIFGQEEPLQKLKVRKQTARANDFKTVVYRMSHEVYRLSGCKANVLLAGVQTVYQSS